MDVLTSETGWALNKVIIKQVASSWSLFTQHFISIWFIYTGFPRMNVPDIGRVFLMLKYTDITQNAYFQSWMVTEIMAREKWGLLAVPHTALVQLTHSAREGVLNECFPNGWLGRGGPVAWPPKSPNLTPLDYYLWGHMKTLVYETKVKSRAALHNRIFAVAEHIRNHPANVASATQSLLMYAEKCIATGGGHFEQLL